MKRTNSDPLITNEVAQFYSQYGYCLVDNVLTAEECRKYLAAAEEVAFDQPVRYEPVMNPDRKYEPFAELLRHKDIVRCLEILQGSRINALQSMLYYKSPGSFGRDLHQDNFYARSEYGAFVGTWLALEDADQENGGLIVYPGSHREAILEVKSDEVRKKTNTGDFSNDRGSSCIVPSDYTKVYLSVRGGSVVIIHGHLIHGSEGNMSRTRYRRVFAGHYIKEGYSFAQGTHAGRKIIDVYRCLGPGLARGPQPQYSPGVQAPRRPLGAAYEGGGRPPSLAAPGEWPSGTNGCDSKHRARSLDSESSPLETA